jgi:hypothetical protein
VNSPVRLTGPQLRQFAIDILAGIAAGYTIEVLALEREMTEGAVSNRLARFRQKIGAYSNTHAVVILAVNGQLSREQIRAAFLRRAPGAEAAEDEAAS